MSQSISRSNVPVDADYIEKVSFLISLVLTIIIDYVYVCMYNSFGVKDIVKQNDMLNAPDCLFIGSSLINHSCYYNAKWACIRKHKFGLYTDFCF
jgi:hypothetical protein